MEQLPSDTYYAGYPSCFKCYMRRNTANAYCALRVYAAFPALSGDVREQPFVPVIKKPAGWRVRCAGKWIPGQKSSRIPANTFDVLSSLKRVARTRREKSL